MTVNELILQVSEQIPKQNANIRKNSLIMQKVKSKTNTNLLKIENIPNKCVSDMDEGYFEGILGLYFKY